MENLQLLSGRSANFSSELSFTWVDFPASVYAEQNYKIVHEEDRLILERLAAFYSTIPAVGPILDLGTGANMYPILAMLPKMGIISCNEPAGANVLYLKRQSKVLDPMWWQYWRLLQEFQPETYKDINVQEALRRRMLVWQDGYDNLAENYYKLASMFFCAESITSYKWRFEEVCKAFVGSLVPGGYFAAAFMENSEGWDVSGRSYPAIVVTPDIIRDLFQQWSDDAVVEHIPVAASPLREGYTGMVFITGTRRN